MPDKFSFEATDAAAKFLRRQKGKGFTISAVLNHAVLAYEQQVEADSKPKTPTKRKDKVK
jgi:hypothetical protein